MTLLNVGDNITLTFLAATVTIYELGAMRNQGHTLLVGRVLFQNGTINRVDTILFYSISKIMHISTTRLSNIANSNQDFNSTLETLRNYFYKIYYSEFKEIKFCILQYLPIIKVGDQARIIRFLKKNRNFVFLLDLFFSYLRFAISK